MSVRVTACPTYASPVATTVIPFEIHPTAIDGLTVMRLKQVRDERGVVREFYRESAFVEAGLPSLGKWLQMNVTESRHGVIRGLHGEAMFKLVGIVDGEAFGAYVDTRPDSPTAGAVATVRLRKGWQVLVPKGVCNGFQSVSKRPTQYLYAFDAEWVPGMAGSAVTPLDPALAIPWPVAVDPDDLQAVSAKDRTAPTAAEALRIARG